MATDRSQPIVSEPEPYVSWTVDFVLLFVFVLVLSGLLASVLI